MFPQNDNYFTIQVSIKMFILLCVKEVLSIFILWVYCEQLTRLLGHTVRFKKTTKHDLTNFNYFRSPSGSKGTSKMSLNIPEQSQGCISFFVS